MPRAFIIAGPNGVGKSTFARRFLPTVGIPFSDYLNADDIAAGLNPAAPETVAYDAGRIFLEQVEAKVALGEDFAVETTLAGRGYVSHIRTWKNAGYEVVIVFLRLPVVDESIHRVARRVGHGGHNIPEDVIRTRFVRGLKNLLDLFRFEPDEWKLYDNSGQFPVLIAAQSESGLQIADPGLWEAVRVQVETAK